MNFKEYLVNEGVTFNEMTVESMVDKCIEEGKTKKGALKCAKKYKFGSEVENIIKKLPNSMFESMVESNISYSDLLKDFSSVEDAIIDFLSEDDDYEEDDEEDDEEKDCKLKKSK